jgi:hypothetical protein
MQAIAKQHLELPKLNILRGAQASSTMELQVDAEGLKELIEHWRATRVGDADVEVPAPTIIDGRVALTAELISLVIETKDRDIEMLKSKVTELRRDRVDDILREPRTQYYTLCFVKDSLASLRQKQKALSEVEADTERQRDALGEEKAQWAKIKEEQRFCNIRRFEEKLDKMLQALEAFEEQDSPSALEKWEELYGGEFKGLLHTIGKHLDKLRQTVADQEVARDELRCKLQDAKKKDNEAHELFHEANEAKLNQKTLIAKGAAATVKTLTERYLDANLVDKVEAAVLLRSTELEDEAMLRAQKRMCFIAESDPEFVKRAAKDIALRETDENLVQWHRVMMKDPKGRPRGQQQTYALGYNVGVWLRANDW